jgi:hypothetical protein
MFTLKFFIPHFNIFKQRKSLTQDKMQLFAQTKKFLENYPPYLIYEGEKPKENRRKLPHWQFLWRLWHVLFQWHQLLSHSLSAWPHPSLFGRVSIEVEHRFVHKN